jgi:predicted TIM-barrel fold metal-dependent hydrolase
VTETSHLPDWRIPLVDSHAHIFLQDMPLINNPRHTPGYSFSLAQYLATLDAHGIRFGVIAAASPWGDYNDYTVASVGREPRLRGTVILHPGKRYDFQAMSANGICGVRLPFIGLPQVPDLTTPDYQRLLREIADAGWHVHPHIEGKHLPALLPILEKAGVPIVVDHLGRPAADEPVGSAGFRAVAAAVKRGTCWIKVSCGYRIGPRAEEHFFGFLQELGPQNLFWGSDCPFVGHENQFSFADTIRWLTDRITDDEVGRQLMGSNALAFYGFG